MTTTIGLRQILDASRWEYMTPAPVATGAATFVVSSRHFEQRQLYVTSNTVAYLLKPGTNGWVQVPSPALAGTFGAGACGVAGGFSTGTTVAAASLTATAGTNISITTNQTLACELRGYSVHILSGPNAGETKVIERNTIGSNAVITFTAASGSAFSASTVYRLITPVWYVLGAGTLATGSFRKYDLATNTWTSLTITGLPATVGTDGRLVSTPSWMDDGYLAHDTGTATSATATTLVDSGGGWTASQWINSQVRITGGTGAGQIRSITANTSTTLTVATWTVTPDATSTYSIEGSDDYLYFLGNNAVTMYRYSISGNSWSTLSPGVARGGAPTTGMSAHWVWGVTAADWTSAAAIQNGRYIYSFRGAGGALLDRYDIAANSWSAVTYSPATETLTTGTKYAYAGDALYIQQNATGRWFRFDFARAMMDGWGTMLLPQGTAVLGDTAFDVTYRDGATDVVFIYMILNTSTVMLRCMVI
jgi:hypothetical protein